MSDRNIPDDNVMSIPADDLRAVMPFRGMQDVRYYLNGVYVEKIDTGGCLLVATNGHLLAVLQSPAAYIDQSRIVAVSDGLSQALRQSDDIQRTVEVAGEHGHVTLRAPGREVFIQPDKPFIDGKYPEWRKVVPALDELEPGLTADVSAEYLAMLKRATRKSSWRNSISFWHQKSNPRDSAVIARFEGNSELVLVIMPMKVTHAWTWPSWVKRETEKKEVAA